MQMMRVTRSKFACRSLSVLVVLLMCGASVISGALAQSAGGPRLVVLAQALNVRSGPGVGYAIIAGLRQGDTVDVIGRHSASGWWQVELNAGGAGWVTGGAQYVRLEGDGGSVPEVAATAVAPDAPGPKPTAPPVGGLMVFQTVSGGPIYAINADGTNLRYLTTGIDPALSPDRRQVAFTRWDSDSYGAPGSVWVINVDGTGERSVLGEVRQPKSPTWMPDGSPRLIINMQNGGRLDVVSNCQGFDGKHFPRLPRGAFNIRTRFTPPDEYHLCYKLPPDPHWGLRLIDVTTGAFQDLPRDIYSYSPTWNPAQPWQVVYTGEAGLISLDLNRGTTWLITQDARDNGPVFSPDGRRIAVSYWQHDHWEIHVMNVDGSGRARLTETPLRALAEQTINGQEPRSWNNAAPSWSPDGTQIAFVSDRSGQWEFWVMNADGSNQRPLFPPGALAGLTLQFNGVDERMLTWR
jgi:dipeptidyl aminopeptidase/acylaminoacyl peptidase